MALNFNKTQLKSTIILSISRSVTLLEKVKENKFYLKLVFLIFHKLLQNVISCSLHNWVIKDLVHFSCSELKLITTFAINKHPAPISLVLSVNLRILDTFTSTCLILLYPRKPFMTDKDPHKILEEVLNVELPDIAILQQESYSEFVNTLLSWSCITTKAYLAPTSWQCSKIPSSMRKSSKLEPKWIFSLFFAGHTFLILFLLVSSCGGDFSVFLMNSCSKTSV